MKRVLKPTSRRNFLKEMLLGGTACAVLPSYVLGLHGETSPNSKLAIAFVGIGGRGGHNLNGLCGEKVVALCDVDEARSADQRKRFEKVPFYQDYRVMLDKHEKEIDAVAVSTPDHTHAIILKNAMQRGKHVFSEKPLAHSIHEVRALDRLARESKVVTQAGNQGRSYDSIRVFREWLEDGVIGQVKEAHLMCNSSYSFISRLGELKEKHEVPKTLDWDLWLGGAAARDYHPLYAPGVWRFWRDFGSGVLGDWICHIADPLFYALALDYPSTITAHPVDYDPKKYAQVFPVSSEIEFEFKVGGREKPLKVTWYEGKCRPPRPAGFEDPDKKFPGIGPEFFEMGGHIIGDKGDILYGSHGATGVKVLDEEKMKSLSQEPTRIPKSPGYHQEWIKACKGEGVAESPFSYCGKLTEVGLLGCIAMLFPDEKLEWDGRMGKFTNNEKANEYLNPPARKGWEV